MQLKLCILGYTDVRTLHDKRGFDLVLVVRANDVGSRGRHQDIAVDGDHCIPVEPVSVGKLMQMTAALLERDQLCDIKTIGPVHRSGGVCGSHKQRPLLGEKARCVLADRAEALHCNTGPIHFAVRVLTRCQRRDDHAESGRADLIQRYAAELPRQPNAATDLVQHPCHRRLVGTHVGASDIVGDRSDRIGKCTHQLFLRGRVHGWIGKYH